MLVAVAAGGSFAGVRVEVPAQGFDAGGWGLDSQFMDVMGSPYLIAHGLGVRVADATAKVRLPSAGTYRVWVRTRNWADGAPGRFKVAVGGVTLAKTFGADRREWAWEDGGTIAVRLPDVTVALRDLTGFDGRCAGVVFATPDAPAPEGPIRVDAKPVSETVNADFIVVGGGLPGTCAAVAAARRGLKVVLVQDRPVLGGNASGEIRVWCAGEARYPLVRELRGLFMNRDVNTPLVDDRRMRLVADDESRRSPFDARLWRREECGRDDRRSEGPRPRVESHRPVHGAALLRRDGRWLGRILGGCGLAHGARSEG